ncbi:MAG: ATP-binding protein [Cyanobacteria bacterium P01_E01_bin.42]
MSNDKPLPRLDLAPKLDRPLSLRNPLDYLRLLYWVFYFPQALRWYVDEFGGGYIPESEMNIRKGLQILRENAIQRQLLLQGIILILFIQILIYGFSNNWMSIAFWVVVSVVFGVVFSIARGVAFGVALSLVLSVTLGLALGLSEIVIFSWLGGGILGSILGIILGMTLCFVLSIGINWTFIIILGLVLGMVFGFAKDIALSMLFGLALGATVGIVRGVSFGLTRGVAVGVVGGMSFGLMRGIAVGVVGGMSFGLAFSVSFGLAFSVFIFRPDSWLLGKLFNFKRHNSSWLFFKVTVIPLKSLVRKLQQSLDSNWEIGLHNSNELLRYSYQLTSVVDAINETLSQSPKDDLIWKIASLAHQPFDWKLLGFASISQQQIQATFKRNLYIGFSTEGDITEIPCLDTFPCATAAGFLYLHKKEPARALKAFKVVCDILYGKEMYVLAQALTSCTQATEFNKIHDLILPPCPKQRLRPASWRAIEAFHHVIREAKSIHNSKSKAVRAQSLARAQGDLKQILDNADELPQAEGDLILDIATTWRDAFLDISTDIGNLEILESIQIPYTIGDPVEGSRFVGREDILQELENLWLQAKNPSSVLLYGHRRMGKTSILRNLTGESDLKLIYVNLQLLGTVSQGVSEVLQAIADEIAQQLHIPAPPDEAFLIFPQRTFDRYLREALKQLDGNVVIIALDEFEIIEELIEGGHLDAKFMGYLRGLIQKDKRLAFALAGLHTLEEMTRDYFEPFFGSTYPIRVGYLNPSATRQILENPSEDFPLEYEPAAVDEIYRLTCGQPYLVQLIGFQLVRRFNDRLFETGKTSETKLTLADVAAVTDITGADLFRNGRYYFDGVWKQANQGAPHQQALLTILARHPQGLPPETLQNELKLDEKNLNKAVEDLDRHDVIHKVENHYKIVVELFRIWVENTHSTS